MYRKTDWGGVTNHKESFWSISGALSQDKRTDHSKQAGLEVALGSVKTTRSVSADIHHMSLDNPRHFTWLLLGASVTAIEYQLMFENLRYVFHQALLSNYALRVWPMALNVSIPWFLRLLLRRSPTFPPAFPPANSLNEL